MTARILKFPTRAIRVIRADFGSWLVLAGSNGWLHGDQNSAITDAQWLAENFGLPIRNVTSNGSVMNAPAMGGPGNQDRPVKRKTLK